jgi:hypothetical protein
MLTLLAVALAADPKTIEVTYEVKFDLSSQADAVCAMTGICDCDVTWSGRGALVSSEGSTRTYHGTWKVARGSCNDALMLWTPTDGDAYHTVRLSDDGTSILEWIAHDRAGDTTRFADNIKARGQVWLGDFKAPINPGTHTATHQEKDTGDAGGIAIASAHTLTVVFGY